MLYWPLALFIPKPVFLELINGVVASSSIGIVMAFIPGAWTSLRLRPYRLQGAHLLVLGITLLQFAIAALFAWGWAYRVFDKPEWMIDHLFRGWLVYLISIAGLLHLMATDIEHEAMPSRGWMRLCAAVAAGLLLSVILILFVGE